VRINHYFISFSNGENYMRYMIIIFALIITGAASFPAYCTELDDLKALVRQLQQRVEQLENRQKMEALQQKQTPVAQREQAVAEKQRQVPFTQQEQSTAAAKPVTEGSIPGSLLIPGTDTSLRIYGNARVDATYDFKGRNNDVLDNDWASAVFAQPFDTDVANRTRKKQFYATARASRLGFVTSTPTPISALEIKVEADFNAPNDYMGELGSNGTMFRLRHAYGKLGNMLVGQTWSNFIDLRSYPETVDFNPPGSATLIRQTQARYTLPLGASTLSFSIENPESLTQVPPVQKLSNGARNDFDRIPDFTANWTWNSENGHLSARGATLEYNNDFHSKRGYAFGLSGSSKMGPGTIVAGIQGGDGIGRYMFNSLLQGATETGTDLRLWKAMGWHLGYTYTWNSSLRSNFIISQTTFGTDRAADAYLRTAWLGKADEFIPNKRIDQAYVNLFWKVVNNVETGIEYAWGKRVTFGDEKGTQQRINSVIMYNFP
jgi:hypothetical protein